MIGGAGRARAADRPLPERRARATIYSARLEHGARARHPPFDLTCHLVVRTCRCCDRAASGNGV